MARPKKLTYGAVNITMHPHSPEKYVELFRMARKNARNVNLRGGLFRDFITLLSLQERSGS